VDPGSAAVQYIPVHPPPADRPRSRMPGIGEMTLVRKKTVPMEHRAGYNRPNVP
jgi:hypothetical protein